MCIDNQQCPTSVVNTVVFLARLHLAKQLQPIKKTMLTTDTLDRLKSRLPRSNAVQGASSAEVSYKLSCQANIPTIIPETPHQCMSRGAERI